MEAVSNENPSRKGEPRILKAAKCTCKTRSRWIFERESRSLSTWSTVTFDVEHDGKVV
jgi:hypothetical protein